MLMLAILALGMLTFRIGKAAVLRSGAQTAADAAALAGAAHDPRPADRADGDDRHVRLRARQRAARARRRRRLREAQRRAADGHEDGGRRRARLGRHRDEKIDAPKDDREGKARRAGARRARDFQSPGFGGGGGGGGGRRHRRRHDITDKEWKELEKDLHKPLDCHDIQLLADFFKAHGAIPPYENVYTRRPADRRPAASAARPRWHYACGNSGAIDLNYPRDRGVDHRRRSRPHLIKLGFFTMWQVENHYDHMHIDPPAARSPARRRGGAAGSLTDSLLEVKLVDWDAPSPTGLGGRLRRRPGRHPVRPAGPAGRERRSARCSTA